MMNFAKLYESKKYGQILVRKDSFTHAVIFSINPPGQGICSSLFVYSSDDEGLDMRDLAFDLVDEQEALAVAEKIFEGAVLNVKTKGNQNDRAH